MFKELPKFEPVSTKEMRAFWKRYRGDKDIERLLLEVAYGRRVIRDIDAYFVSVHRAWRDANLGTLVALEKTRLLLMEQHLRQGALVGLPPPPKRDEPPESEPALID